MPPTCTTTRKRGRRRTETIPAERERHLAAYYSVRVLKKPVVAVARMCEVERRTVQRWCKQASRYPESAALRELATAI